MGGSSKPPTERSALLLSSEPPALSTTTIIAYATPALPSSARDIFIMLYLRKFYVDTLGVPPARLAVIDAGVHATHYFTAIFSGVMIDSTNVAFGRRRTHLLIWSIVTAVAAALLFGIPDGGLFSSNGPSPWGWHKVVAYYACLKVVYDVAPLGLTWQALGPELTQRVQERNRLYAVTQSMHWLGNLCGATLPALLIALLSSDELRLVFGATALIIAVALVAAFVALVALVREPDTGAPPCSPFDAVPTLRNAARNRCFVVMVLLDVMYAISKAFGDGLAVFFVQVVSTRPSSSRTALTAPTSPTSHLQCVHLSLPSAFTSPSPLTSPLPSLLLSCRLSPLPPPPSPRSTTSSSTTRSRGWRRRSCSRASSRCSSRRSGRGPPTATAATASGSSAGCSRRPPVSSTSSCCGRATRASATSGWAPWRGMVRVAVLVGSHSWPPRARQTASDGLGLSSALGRRGLAPQMPSRGRGLGLTPHETHRLRRV